MKCKALCNINELTNFHSDYKNVYLETSLPVERQCNMLDRALVLELKNLGSSPSFECGALLPWSSPISSLGLYFALCKMETVIFVYPILQSRYDEIAL